jgi:RimJ/RimL family protein N-acetyltransferase
MTELITFTEDQIPKFIKRVNSYNADFLVQFAGTGYSYPLTTDQLKSDMRNKNHLLFNFTVKSKIIGHCQLTRINIENLTASVGRVLIYSEKRGKGYSSLMLKHLVKYSQEVIGLKKLTLRVFDFNIPAINCYQNLGFTEIIREEIFYDTLNETWNCITMEKSI